MTATATAERPTVKPTANGTTAPDPSRNLYQRLLAIQNEVDHVKATGKTAYNQKAISIEDVEDALGDLFAKHGVVTGYKYNSKPENVGSEGKSTLWLADLTVWMVNPDDPQDRHEDVVFDVGTSPSAAVSFSLKRYYKALFHLADEDDETRSTPTGTARRDEGNGNGQAVAASGLTPDQQLEVTALNASLPKPYDDKVLAAMAKSGYQAASNALRAAHAKQCTNCEHVAKA